MTLVLTSRDVGKLILDETACADAINVVERVLVEDHVQARRTCQRPWRVRSAPRGNATIGLRFDAFLRPAINSPTTLVDFAALLTSVPAAVGCRHLLPETATTLTVLGSGVQAQSCIYMIAAEMPNLSHLRLWRPAQTPDDAWSAELEESLKVGVADCTTASTALANTDVIVILPHEGETPPVQRMEVPPGSLVISIAGAGLHLLERAERLVVPTHSRRKSYPDSLWVPNSERIHQPMRPIGLAEIALGQEEVRDSDEGIVFYDVAGPRVWDAAILQWINSWAALKSIGRNLEF